MSGGVTVYLPTEPYISPDAASEAFGREMERRDAENPDRCEGCGGAHGAVRICGGCEEPVNDCLCDHDVAEKGPGATLDVSATSFEAPGPSKEPTLPSGKERGKEA